MVIYNDRSSRNFLWNSKANSANHHAKVLPADSLSDVSNDCNCFSPEFEYFPRESHLKASWNSDHFPRKLPYNRVRLFCNQRHVFLFSLQPNCLITISSKKQHVPETREQFLASLSRSRKRKILSSKKDCLTKLMRLSFFSENSRRSEEEKKMKKKSFEYKFGESSFASFIKRLNSIGCVCKKQRNVARK
jgi:hypothetical protein